MEKSETFCKNTWGSKGPMKNKMGATTYPNKLFKNKLRLISLNCSFSLSIKCCKIKPRQDPRANGYTGTH